MFGRETSEWCYIIINHNYVNATAINNNLLTDVSLHVNDSFYYNTADFPPKGQDGRSTPTAHDV